ncbi:hypothetical protein GJ744_011999 [Endocarpon pusillum]|uniref:Extracellular membrane protein CFEM domain-containing protein n=1 Tax=Endocarpon pusillum TaxID=364733 RepID=A0A8H7ATJ1_9EURO|nr:hypothetical protein GJ744_011999 [Endocarpon pusillum]
MRASVVFMVGLFAAANASVVKKRTLCTEDNCLRALLNPTRPVASFCSAFLSTSTYPLPTYVAPCSSSLPRISSACDCALGRISSSLPTSAPITTLTCTAET